MHDSIRRAYEILERLSCDEETQTGAFAPSPDADEQWQANMPPARARPDAAELLVGGLRVEVQRNRREADANNQALRAAVLSQRKALDHLPEAIGQAMGKLFAEHRAEIATLRAEIEQLKEQRQDVDAVIDMSKALRLRRSEAA